MKDRLIPCVNYICAGETCLKGVKKVTMSKCQHCQKYQPRKTKNKKKESVKIKHQKDKDRHNNWEEYY